MAPKTLLFCTSYFADQAQWGARYERWLKHHLALCWPISSVAMIDDGSPFTPEARYVQIVDAASVGKVALPRRALVRFADNLGRQGTFTYPGWWRSFLFALDLAELYGFNRIVHVESDSYLLSNRMLEVIESTRTGWTLFWSSHFRLPETAIQVICEDAFAAYAKLREIGPFGFPHQLAEELLPHTAIVKHLIGDRYADFGATLPANADYAVQVTPMMATSIPSSWTRRLKYKPLIDLIGSTDPQVLQVTRAHDSARAPAAANEAPEEILQRGLTAYRRHDFASALAELSVAAQALPQNSNAHKFLAATLMQSGRVQEAILAAERAVGLAATDSGLANMLGAFYASADQTSKALEQWVRALSIDPADLHALRNIQTTEDRLGLGHALSREQSQLMTRRLIAQLVHGRFDRAALNALLEVWDLETLAPEDIQQIVQLALRQVAVFGAKEGRALAHAAYRIKDFQQAKYFIQPITEMQPALPEDQALLQQIEAELESSETAARRPT